MPDTHAVLFDYHGISVYVRLNLGSATPELANFLGPKGVIEATGTTLRILPQTGEDNSPSYYADNFPAKLHAEYVEKWDNEHPDHYGKEPLTDNLLYQGPDWDDLKPHLWTFFEATRTRKPVAEDAVFGNHAALACHMANASYFQKKQVYWDRDARQIKT